MVPLTFWILDDISASVVHRCLVIWLYTTSLNIGLVENEKGCDEPFSWIVIMKTVLRVRVFILQNVSSSVGGRGFDPLLVLTDRQVRSTVPVSDSRGRRPEPLPRTLWSSHRPVTSRKGAGCAGLRTSYTRQCRRHTKREKAQWITNLRYL